MRTVRSSKRILNPAAKLALGYGAIVLAGCAALCLPWLQASPTRFIDNLFTAASAVSTTGLTTVSVSDHYRFAGELLILILIQLGGIGYMTFGSFVMLASRRRLSGERQALLKSDFGLSDDFDIRSFIRTVVVFTLTVEAIGAALLYPVFLRGGDAEAVWSAVFHSVSAFCTAGFSLYNNSFENYAADPVLNAVIFVLSFLGAIGFIVAEDMWQRIRRKRPSTLTTRIILTFSIVTIVLAAGSLMLTEPRFGGDAPVRFLEASFQAMTALTTVGFNTVPIGELSQGALFLLILCMLAGASPSGTGGGIKSTTLVAVACQVVSILRGRKTVTFGPYRIPGYRVQQAFANFGLYVFMLSAGIYLLALTESKPMMDLMFEATSAIGTVGLSTGITSTLSAAGKWIIIGLMFLGRVGPLSAGLALLFHKKEGELDDNLGGWMEDVVVD